MGILNSAGPLKGLQDYRNINVVIAAPQCYADTWFEIFEQLLEFVDYVTLLPFIDRSRIYLSGISMGGYAAWQLGMARPYLFAAAVICCGGGLYWNAGKLTGFR
ncbi:hypothetical protein FACS1894142_4170 [Spirochaetia bacterium]|nr:hypothetical protein FACS1894142_4170 [Spirochaetia bacterium]